MHISTVGKCGTCNLIASVGIETAPFWSPGERLTRMLLREVYLLIIDSNFFLNTKACQDMFHFPRDFDRRNCDSEGLTRIGAPGTHQLYSDLKVERDVSSQQHRKTKALIVKLRNLIRSLIFYRYKYVYPIKINKKIFFCSMY